MTENSASNSPETEPNLATNSAAATAADPAAGADQIDAYIDSVERVLLAVGVAKIERLQILEDLELQITEMLNQQPLPITAEIVESVIAKLAPASQFAANYDLPADEPRSPVSGQPTTIPYHRAASIAAISFALIPLSCILLLFLASMHAVGGAVACCLLLLVAGLVATPINLRKAFHQFRAEPAQQRGRDLAIATVTGYAATVPLLLLAIACLATNGYILFPLAIGSCIYFQWHFIRRLRQRFVGDTPTQPLTKSFKNPLWRFINPAQTVPCV